MRLRIDLGYDGSGFAGFARQADRRTVQGDLEQSLARLLGHVVDTVCAGRTDRGVHALAQVVHLDLDPNVAAAARALDDLERLRRTLDAALGPPITIWAITRVGDGFHARFSARQRVYRYRLVDGVAGADPIRRHDRWHLEAALDVPAMRRGVAHLLGEHDFASFCRRAEGRTTVRSLTVGTVRRETPGRVDLRFAGNAFCHQQVRSMVGCLVEVGRRRRPPDWVAEVLAARDRQAAARVAPPHGLTLERVSYGPGWPAAPPADVRLAATRASR